MALVRDPRVDQILTGRPPAKRTTYRIPKPSSAPSVGSLIGARPARFGEQEALSKLMDAGSSPEDLLSSRSVPRKLSDAGIQAVQQAGGLVSGGLSLFGVADPNGGILPRTTAAVESAMDAVGEYRSPERKRADELFGEIDAREKAALLNKHYEPNVGIDLPFWDNAAQAASLEFRKAKADPLGVVGQAAGSTIPFLLGGAAAEPLLVGGAELLPGLIKTGQVSSKTIAPLLRAGVSAEKIAPLIKSGAMTVEDAAPFLKPAAMSADTFAGLTGVGIEAGSVKQNIAQTAKSAPEEDLLADPRYASEAAEFGSEQARQNLANRASSYAENPGLIALGAAEGYLFARLGMDTSLLRAGAGSVARQQAKQIAKQAARSLPGAGVRGLLKEGLSEGVQEPITTWAGNVGAAIGGANIDPMQGVVASGVQALLMGGLSGGAAGVHETMAARRGTNTHPPGPTDPGELGENPDITGDPLLDALVGRPGSPPGPPGPPAPPARFSEEEALAPLRSPEFTQSDLGVGVDSKARLSPLRDEVSRLREERARRAREIRPATPEEAAQAQRDAEDAFAEPIIDEAMATPPNPAEDPTVQAIVREMDVHGAKPGTVVAALRKAGVPNPAVVVEEVRAALAPELYDAAKTRASELEQADASVQQRAAEEKAYAKLMTALTGSGMTVSQARKVARPAAQEMASEGLKSQEIIPPSAEENKPDRGPLYDQQWQSDEGSRDGEVVASVPLTDEARKKTEQILSSMEEGDRLLDLEGTVWEKKGRFFKTKDGDFVEASSLDGINLLARSAILPAKKGAPNVSSDSTQRNGDLNAPNTSNETPSDAEVSAHFARVADRIREIQQDEPNLPHRVIAQRVNQEFGNDNRLGRGHEALTRRMVDEVLKGEENPKTSDKGNYPGGPVSAMVNSRKDTGLQNDPERALYEAMDRMDRQQGHIAESVAAREEKAAANMAEGERLGERLEESVRNPRGKRVQGQPAVVGADQGGFKEQNRAGVPAQVATDVRPGNREVDVRLENGQAGNSLVANEAPRSQAHGESVPPNAQVKKAGAGEFARDWIQKYAAADIEGRRALVKGLSGKLTYEDMRQLAAYTGANARLVTIDKPDERAPSFARKPSAPAFSRPASPFYSALERAADQMKQPMRGAEALRFLSTREGVKAAELKWTGLDDFLRKKGEAKVTPAEVQEFLKANAVTVTEKKLGGTENTYFTGGNGLDANGKQLWGVFKFEPDDENSLVSSHETWEEAIKARDALEDLNKKSDGPPKFAQYQTPGGTNYREILLTLPRNEPAFDSGHFGRFLRKMEEKYGPNYPANMTEAESGQMDRLRAIPDSGTNTVNFQSSHFSEPNIVVHFRANDRIVNGKKILFIDEIQSDFAQQGRRRGFITDTPTFRVTVNGKPISANLPREAAEKQMADFKAKDKTNAYAIEQDGSTRSGEVPRAPFVEKTEEWTALAMKSILQKAAAEGYDAVAWTTGEQQADRYDLSRQIQAIVYDEVGGSDPVEYTVRIIDSNGVLAHEGYYEADKLEDIVGKDVAKRIVAGEGEENEIYGKVGAPKWSGRILKDQNLKVGGEGMKAFYDRIVPQVAEKIAKKWGGKVGTLSLPVKDSSKSDVGGVPIGKVEVPNKGIQVHSIELTPQMKQGINNEGFPLFARNPKEMTEEDWAWYNSLSDEERSAYWTAALKKEYQVKGARRGIVIADFEGDVPQSVIETMQNSPVSTALAKRVDDAVRMIARVAGYDVEFGGFTPAGNLHGVLFKGKLYLNYLATDQLAKIRAQKTGVSYEAAFGQELLEVILHEYAHKKEAGHGKAHDAEMERLFDLLGENGRVAIVRDGALFAAGKKNNAFIAQMTKESVPGWIEGENRGRQAAAKEQSGRGSRGGVPVESARGSGAEPGASQVGPGRTEGAGDRRSGGVQQVRGSQAGGLAGGPVVRSGDGRVAPQFARKPPAPPGQLLEEETNAQYLQQKLQDRLNRLTLGEVAVNARKGITATPSLANRIYGVSPRVENAVSVAEHSILNPILDGVKKNGLDFDLLGDYAKDDKDAAAKVVSSGKQALYDAARDQIKGVFDRSDAVRLATGIDDEETIAAAKKKRGPSGLKITKEHPLYEAVRELEGSILRAEHNRAMENLADFVEKNGVPEFGRVRQGEPTDGPNDGQNSILLKRNGETWSIDLADDKMAEAIKKLNTDQLDVMTRTVGAVTRWVSRINTLWSPPFTLKNKIRDVGNAVLSSMILNGAPNGISRSVAFKVAAGQVPAWKGTREYMRNPAGKFPQGSPAWWAQQAHKNAAVPGYFKSIESIDRIESRLGSALKASQRQNALRDFGAFLMGLAQAGEASTRVSVYRALVEEGMSPSKAGDVARGTLDVNKRGEWAKAIGAFSPFFNSSAQGTARLVEMVRSPDPAVRQRAQATMASLVTGGLLVGAALAAWGGDDDQDRVPDSDQVPEWDTQRNLVIPWLGGTRLRIPLPQGFSAPFYAGFMLGKTGRGNATAKQAAGNIGTAFYDQFAPISSPFGVAQPLADVARNQKFSGGPIRPIRYPGMLQPSSQMAFKSTSEAAKGVASGLNRLTGGDEAVPGLVDIAPGDLEYLAKAGTGGLGKFLSDAYTASESLVRGETPKRVPLISDFVTDANAGQRARFYEQSRDVDQAESRLKLVEGAVRRGVLQAAVPGMDFSRTPLSDLREATAGVSFSPEQRARFRSQDRALMALKPMFDSASKVVKAIDAMPNGPEKDAAFERLALKVNRAYQAAIRGGAQ